MEQAFTVAIEALAEESQIAVALGPRHEQKIRLAQGILDRRFVERWTIPRLAAEVGMSETV